MTKTTKEPVVKVSFAQKHKAGIEKIKTAVIFGAVVLGVGFYAGVRYTDHQNAVRAHAVQSAVAETASKN